MRSDQAIQRKPKLTTQQINYCFIHMLRSSELFEYAKQHLKPQDFSSASEMPYALLWSSALDAAARNNGVLPEQGAELIIAMELTSKLDNSNGEVTPEVGREAIDLLAWVYAFDATQLNPNYYRELIQDLIIERTIVGKMTKEMASFRDVGRPIDIIKSLDEYSKKLQAVLVDHRQIGGTAFPKDFKPKKLGKFSTGHEWLDQFMNGGQAPGEVYVMLGPTGLGKCLGRGTPVLMYDGSVKPVEEVCVGDLLMGPDSGPRTVESLARGREMLYRVVPTKGAPYIVNESHILSLKLTPQEYGDEHAVVHISVRDYLRSSRWFRSLAKGWRTGVEFTAKPVPLDPYLVGLWLGDGASESQRIYTTDPEIVEYLEQTVRQYGMRLGVVDDKNGKCPGYSITHGNVGRPNPIITSLRSLGLMSDKFVPDAYKTNARHVRLAILAGLLDSDGEMHDSMFVFSNKSERLANDVAYLARSLGLAAYVKRKRKTCQTGETGTYYVVNISGDCSVIPTRLPRKQAQPRRQKKDVLVTGITVEPVGEGDYFGFTLSGADRQFLLGDFTVTHNTTCSVMITTATARVWNKPWKEGLIPKPKISCFFSWEQDLDRLRLRFWSYAARVDSNRLELYADEAIQLSTRERPEKYEMEELTQEELKALGGEKERLEAAMEELNETVRIYDFSGADENPRLGEGGIDEVAAVLRVLQKDGKEIGVVVLDYAGACVRRMIAARGEDPSNMRHYLANFCNECRFKIAIPFNCPVWVMHQLNTEANKRAATAEQHHSYASECGNFAENAWFAFVFSTKDKVNNICRLYCTKERRAKGDRPPVILKIEGNFCRMTDITATTIADEVTKQFIPRDMAARKVDSAAMQKLRKRLEQERPGLNELSDY